MSIATKTGDAGTTALLYHRRVSKCHPRVEACGTVDELNAALGAARAASRHRLVGEALPEIQHHLITLMGELATDAGDLARYARDGYPLVTSQLTAKLDQWVSSLEAMPITGGGWAIPGANVSSASLDVARTVCRRAERRVCALQEAGHIPNAEILVYLNRLSDLLWLLARLAESTEPERIPAAEGRE